MDAPVPRNILHNVSCPWLTDEAQSHKNRKSNQALVALCSYFFLVLLLAPSSVSISVHNNETIMLLFTSFIPEGGVHNLGCGLHFSREN